MTDFCPHCEDIREIEEIKRVEETKVKGKKVASTAVFSVCSICKNEFATGEQMDITLKNAYAEYRKQEGIITPEKIIALREKYNISQKTLAKLLDLGELTINSYEQGSLPAKSISNLLRMIETRENFITLYNSHKSIISPLQKKKIDIALNKNIHPLYEYRIENNSLMAAEKSISCCYNKIDRIINIFQLILHFSNKHLYKMAMLKMAFYIDFVNYKRHGESISGCSYAAINHGPVPDGWKHILRSAEYNQALAYEPDEMEMGDLYFLPETISINEIISRFSETECTIIKEVTNKLKDKTATSLRDMTHKEDAWKKTPHASIIDYEHARSLRAF